MDIKFIISVFVAVLVNTILVGIVFPKIFLKQEIKALKIDKLLKKGEETRKKQAKSKQKDNKHGNKNQKTFNL